MMLSAGYQSSRFTNTGSLMNVAYTCRLMYSLGLSGSPDKYPLLFTGTLAATDLPALTVKDKALTAQNEQQTVQILNATDGKFTLKSGASTSSPINFGASAAVLKTALATAVGGAGNIDVSLVGNTYTITFKGALAAQHVAPLTADAGQLRNSTPLGSINVSVDHSATTNFVSPGDLVSLLQGDINTALKNAGLTPGFVATSLLGNGSTFSGPLVINQGVLRFGDTNTASATATVGATKNIIINPGASVQLEGVGNVNVAGGQRIIELCPES